MNSQIDPESYPFWFCDRCGSKSLQKQIVCWRCKTPKPTQIIPIPTKSDSVRPKMTAGWIVIAFCALCGLCGFAGLVNAPKNNSQPSQSQEIKITQPDQNEARRGKIDSPSPSSSPLTQEFSTRTSHAAKPSPTPSFLEIEPITRSRSARNTKPARSSRRSNLIRGPRGGCYYINSHGNKTYVDRSLCN